MNDEEIKRAIAEHLGWKWFDHPDTREMTKTYTLADKWVLNPAGKLVFPHSVPNYSHDLNAMHEAEKVLTDVQCLFYTDNMREVLTEHAASRRTWHATARQRAEAFLRTVGKWRGEQ